MQIPQHEILESWTAAIMRRSWIADLSVSNNKLYAVLSCVAYMLNAIDANNTFSSDLTNLINAYPVVPVTAMGFPTGWASEPLWQ